MQSTLTVPAFVLASLLVGCASQAPPAQCPPVTGATAGSAADDADAELEQLSREDLARKMMELVGAQRLGKQALDSMLQTFEKMPNMPRGFLERFRSKARPEQLTELIVPIYVKNYDGETMAAAIRFYRSNRGRALIAGLPIVTKESIEAGQAWGRELAQKTLEEMGVSPPKQ